MTQPTRGPLDLYLVYLTPSAHGVGQRLAVRTIERHLATLPLRPTLRLLAILAHRADVSVRDHSERLVLAQVLLRPGPWRDRAVALVQGGQSAVVSSQVALQLAQRALVHCPDIPATIGDGELGFRIGTLILALADHMSSGSRNDDELLLELVRLHGRQLLETLLSNPETLSCPEAEQASGPNIPPACDFYIDEASAVIAGDFVHRVLTLPTQTTGSPKALEKDLRYAIVEKVKQIDSTLTLKAPTAERIYPVIVMSGPLPMNPILTGKLKRLLAEEALQVIGGGPPV